MEGSGMIYILLFIFIAFEAAYRHGSHEGMIMIQFSDSMHSGQFAEGVRGHDWFGCYHLISPCRNLVFILVGAMIVMVIIISGVIPILKVIPAIFFFCWELAEIGYAEARGGRMIYKHNGEPYEHVFLTDWIEWKVAGKRVYWLHIFRSVLGISLLIGGLK